MNRLTLWNLYKKNPKFFLLGVATLFISIILIFTMSVRSVIFFFMIIAETFLAIFLGLFQIKKFGLEFVTLITVLGGFLYGPLTGLIVGLIVAALHILLSQSFGPYLFYLIPTFGLVGFLAGSIAGVDIVFLGILLSVVYNVITASLGIIFYKDFFGELLWSGTNLIINFVLFTSFVPILLPYIK